ncbi:MAG: hypothetical protein J6Q84_06680 [Kiritimatiellae bacterium]|nr:hypothetical protein [Kiritimatiellia bacterium]
MAELIDISFEANASSENINATIETNPASNDVNVELTENRSSTNVEVVPPDADAKTGEAADAKATYDALSKKANTEDIPKLDDYAKKSDIPSLDGYVKTEDIPSLDGYAKTEDVDKALEEKANKADVPSLEGYAKTEDVYKELNKKANKADIPSLDGYAKKSDVDYELEKKANKGDVEEALDKKVDKTTLDSYVMRSTLNTLLAKKADTSQVEAVEGQIKNVQNVQIQTERSLHYDLVEMEVVDGDVWLSNRAINSLTVDGTAAIIFYFPEKTSGKARDFYLRLNFTGDTIPEFSFYEEDGSSVSFDEADESWAEFEPGNVYVLRFLDTAEG